MAESDEAQPDAPPEAGRRKFVREVGSVVLGVLIALGIGEIAEWGRWQWRISVSRDAMRTELAGNRFNVVERGIYQPCLERRLEVIGAILAEARRTRRLPLVGPIEGPGRRPAMRTAFDVATGEGVFLHMPRGEARELSGLYLLSVNYYEAGVLAELEEWARLALIENAPGPIDDDLLASLLEAWAQATSRADWIGLIAQQSDETLAAFGIPIESLEDDESLAAFRRQAEQSPLCSPMIVDGRPVAPAGAAS